MTFLLLALALGAAAGPPALTPAQTFAGHLCPFEVEVHRFDAQAQFLELEQWAVRAPSVPPPCQ